LITQNIYIKSIYLIYLNKRKKIVNFLIITDFIYLSNNKFKERILSHAEDMRVLSGINCGMQSLVSYLDAKNNGVTPQVATAQFAGNLFNGLARNEVAYEMQRFGNPIGNTINLAAGYGNPVSNTIGTLGLMSACSPWMFFNSPCCYSSYGMMGYGMAPYYGIYGMGWGMGGFCC